MKRFLPSAVWLGFFYKIRWKIVESPLLHFVKRSARWNKPTWKSESISHMGISDDQSQPSLILFPYSYSGLMNFALISFSTFVMTPSPVSSVFLQPSKLAAAQFLQGKEARVNCNNGLQLLLCCRNWAAAADCCHFICLWTSLWPHGKE